MNKSQNQNVSRLSYSHKMHLVEPLDLFTNGNDRFPHPFHILQLMNSLLFHISEALKSFPLRVEPPRIDHCRKFPARDKNTSY